MQLITRKIVRKISPGTNTSFAKTQEDFNTQVSEEPEVKITNKMSKGFIRTEERILGALSRLDEFLLNPLFQGSSGSVPETSRNTLNPKQGSIEDDSQVDRHPEARIPQS